MSESVHIAGPIGFMENSGSAVFFSKDAAAAGTFRSQRGTAPIIQKVQAALDVAYWGEDNRFPQNIEQQMAYCGVGKHGLDWKARCLYGSGIIPGRISDYLDDGTTEVFAPLTRAEGKEIYAFLENRAMFRFWLEYFQDWTWYANCFPEVILTKDAKQIAGFVHQESCDARFKQMNDQGIIDTVYLSKMWGTSSSQFAKFDPDKKILGIMENPTQLTTLDNKFLKAINCIDMYNSLESLTEIAANLETKEGLKSAILPVNYPSVNKTYYQVATWDGARLGGWVEIACKQPQIIKLFLKKGQKIQNHIEVPETYFQKKYGATAWKVMDAKKQNEARKKLLKEMDEFLTSDKAAFSTFVSFFDIKPHTDDEKGRIKITPITSAYNIDKDIVTTSAANIEILTAMGLHPTLIGSGTIGTGKQATGGSDQREAYLIYTSLLKLERQVALEPLYLARDFNQWGDDIVFRILDTQLTTLDKNTGTVKKIS